MARVTIDLDEGELAATIGAVRAKVRDLTPLMRRFSATVLTAINLRFRQHGPGWPKHAPSTEAKRGKGAPMLRDKARLVASITGGAGGFVKLGSDFLEYGSNIKYARIHNFGGQIVQPTRRKAGPDVRARKSARAGRQGAALRKASSIFGKPTVGGQRNITIPARRFLPLEEEIEEDLLAEAQDYLEEVMDAG